MPKIDLQTVLPEEWWHLDTRWACGAVVTRGGVVVEAAPIYRCFIGQKLSDVTRRGRYEIIPLTPSSPVPHSRAQQ